MAAPVYSVADFAAGLLRLLPSGRAWPKEAFSVLAQVVAAQAPSHARLQARANALLVDAFPATAAELLPEWEATLGLPDPCAGADQTIAQRQAHVAARLTQTNGPSIASLTAFAAAVGYTITITEYVPSRYGQAVYGDPYLEAAWAHAWTITVAGGSLQSAAYGSARFGDPYQTYGSTVLQCEMGRIAPAQTVVRFAYTDPNAATANPPGAFLLGRDVLAA